MLYTRSDAKITALAETENNRNSSKCFLYVTRYYKTTLGVGYAQYPENLHSKYFVLF